MRWWRYGDPHLGEPLDSRARASLADRFWAKVDKRGPIVRDGLTPCWLWMAYRAKSGHGRIGRGTNTAGIALAHVVSWDLHYPGTRTNRNVLHRCDNPPCVNPEHLFLGTQTDNVADMLAKGRGAVGTAYPFARLTDDAVREIRATYAAGGISQAALAGRFGVNQSQVARVVSRRTWKHVA